MLAASSSTVATVRKSICYDRRSNASINRARPSGRACAVVEGHRNRRFGSLVTERAARFHHLGIEHRSGGPAFRDLGGLGFGRYSSFRTDAASYSTATKTSATQASLDLFVRRVHAGVRVRKRAGGAWVGDQGPERC